MISFISCNRITNYKMESNDKTSNTNEGIVNYNDILNLPVEYMSAAYVFDMNDLSELIGYVDYVFIGKVVDYIRTDYEYPVDKNGNHYQIDNPLPSTVYNIKVINNIKNELCQDIELYKGGGLKKDLKSVVLYDETSLFEINDINIFYGIVQPDGRIFTIGKDKYVNLDMTESYDEDQITEINKKITHNEKYQAVLKALANEKVYDRKRSITDYDINLSEHIK